MRELLTVGQLARRSGLTPKALRHYDRIGLLRPARVDPPGPRLYDPAPGQQAELVARLRAVDLPVERARACLGASEETVRAVLVAHRQRLAARMTRTQSALHRLDHFIADGIGAPMSTKDSPSVN